VIRSDGASAAQDVDAFVRDLRDVEAKQSAFATVVRE
jgi:hypothetical protein